ncbi:MAG: alpha/beta hydrolase [Microbacterium sp.]|nr:alpha/beta hydrolase [Microbacterium sp.]MDP3950687.1 alpha/beta hydrolase [Microbacterium sp.]
MFRVIATERPDPAQDATAFVLVHGIGTSHRYFQRLHDTLALTAPVISVDLPGFGDLPRPDADIDVSQMADGLSELLRECVSGPVVLVGHSMGAQWVVETALRHPELVAHVVVIGPVTDEKHRTVFAQARALALDMLGESPLINAVVLADYLRCGMPWYMTQLRHMLVYPIEDRVRELTKPLLIIRGSSDPVAGRTWCRRLRDLAPGASTLVEVPGGHHVVQFAAPAAVACAIRSHTAPRAPEAIGT